MSDSLSDIWKLKRRGKRDSSRHKELIKEAIKSNSKDIIKQYDVITTDGSKKIKVPIKFLDQYKFKYGKLFDKNNIGQGLSGKKGTKYKIGNSKRGTAQGSKPGDEPEDPKYEEEISLDEMVDILIEELNLPWMKETQSSKIESTTEVFDSIEKKGLFSNMDMKKTLLNNIKRNIAQNNDKLIGNFHNEDLRFKSWEEINEYSSNAAVYMLMDRSGSMTRTKKEIAKTFYFWMVQFLKRKYKNVELVFIAHDVNAYEVTEKEFFTISSGGGTKCSSAFKKALELIKKNHPPESYNNYVFEFSDGDNSQQDNVMCYKYIQELLPLCRAIGYGEILHEGDIPSWLQDYTMLSDYLNKKIKRTRFVSFKLTDKSDIFLSLKKFFNIDKSKKEKSDE